MDLNTNPMCADVMTAAAMPVVFPTTVWAKDTGLFAVDAAAAKRVRQYRTSHNVAIDNSIQNAAGAGYHPPRGVPSP